MSKKWPAARSRACTRLRSVTSLIAAITSRPSWVSTGFRLISTESSLPSLRRARRSTPLPITRATGRATNAAL